MSTPVPWADANTVKAGAPVAPVLTGGALVTVGVACAVCVANAYYGQPLLADIARGLGLSPRLAGLAPTMTQAGIALGMAFLLPLGDRIDNRVLVTTLLKVQALALVLMAQSTDAPVYLGAALLAGTCGIVTYLLPAYATRLVSPDRRGSVTGALGAGIMLGITLGRSMAGIAGEALGWRGVYAAAAVATLLVALVLQRVMPRTPALVVASYRSLLASLATLARTVPLLRRATVLQALSFGLFNALWIGLALRLQQPPFGLDTRRIGLLALLAVSSVVAAPLVGRLADRGGMRLALRGATVITLAGWIALVAGAETYTGVVLAMLLCGTGATASDVVLRSAIYGHAPDQRMRMNAVYSTGTFIGGSVFSLITPLGLGQLGWYAVVVGGIAFASLLLALSWRALPGRDRPAPNSELRSGSS